MRFTTAVVAGLLAIARAQDTTTSPSSTESATPTISVDPVQASVLACLENCDSGDVSCQASCVTVPNPSDEMVSLNNECVGNCPQGNGTEADISAYASCQAGCYASYYYTTDIAAATDGATATNSADGSDSTDSADGSDDSDSSDDSSDDSSGSDDDSDDSSDSDDNGAGAIGISGAAFGLTAFLAAFVAL